MDTKLTNVQLVNSTTPSLPISLFYTAHWSDIADPNETLKTIAFLFNKIPMDELKKFATDILACSTEIPEVYAKYRECIPSQGAVQRELVYAKQVKDYKTYIANKVVALKQPVEALSFLALYEQFNAIPVIIVDGVMTYNGFPLAKAITRGNEKAIETTSKQSKVFVPKLMKAYVHTISSDEAVIEKSGDIPFINAGINLSTSATIVMNGILAGDVRDGKIYPEKLDLPKLGAILTDNSVEIKLDYTTNGTPNINPPYVSNSAFFQRMDLDFYGMGLNSLSCVARFKAAGVDVTHATDKMLHEDFDRIIEDRLIDKIHSFTIPFNHSWIASDFSIRTKNATAAKAYHDRFGFLEYCQLKYMGPGVTPYLLIYNAEGKEKQFISAVAFNTVPVVVSRLIKYYNFVRVVKEAQEFKLSTFFTNLKKQCKPSAIPYLELHISIFDYYLRELKYHAPLVGVSVQSKRLERIVSTVGAYDKKTDENVTASEAVDLFGDTPITSVKIDVPQQNALMSDDGLIFSLIDDNGTISQYDLNDLLYNLYGTEVEVIISRVLVGGWAEWKLDVGAGLKKKDIDPRKMFTDVLRHVSSRDYQKAVEALFYNTFKSVSPVKIANSGVLAAACELCDAILKRFDFNKQHGSSPNVSEGNTNVGMIKRKTDNETVVGDSLTNVSILPVVQSKLDNDPGPSIDYASVYSELAF